MSAKSELVLFGGEKGWKPAEWTASDDRVRGGKSQSFLDCQGTIALFRGHLDIHTLGGAGFASQRTVAESSVWDLSNYSGIQITILPVPPTGEKRQPNKYTFILKDELLERNPDNAREQATVSYEYDFVVDEGEEGVGKERVVVCIPWGKLKATYRGKEKKDARELDVRRIRRFSIMMRSFFGEQEGGFSLTIENIKALKLSEDLEKGLLSNEEGALSGCGPKVSL
ncbi:NADH:ubiquinone oxidoreductase complex I intermediate-associated protein 30 [Delitschia confertaspora ATCC 74209]|uniref:NADH:ubiquinone oxidoreductase complex I intermediate-associated protein 30 n=1 Tax=Delitschia confertaspora ATCC 74209 TaxID=1513339 RepID=A0A9P4JNF0_9PLEO|nr:NADH:ubiquinone oxidoreductase complex I intermediate-associated protein 30 [Delitschia confertaspora ATCC 74209]